MGPNQNIEIKVADAAMGHALNFRIRRDPSTIAKVTWRTTSPVGRQSTVRALPDGSGLPGADRPLSPVGRDSKTAVTFRGKV